jgi:hypothetical protein
VFSKLGVHGREERSLTRRRKEERKKKKKQEKNVHRYKVTLRRVRVNIVAMEKR